MCPKFEDENLPEKFSAEVKFCKIHSIAEWQNSEIQIANTKMYTSFLTVRARVQVFKPTRKIVPS
jgi:hypothetical protein